MTLYTLVISYITII